VAAPSLCEGFLTQRCERGIRPAIISPVQQLSFNEARRLALIRTTDPDERMPARNSK
jgi:hypothetical protein